LKLARMRGKVNVIKQIQENKIHTKSKLQVPISTNNGTIFFYKPNKQVKSKTKRRGRKGTNLKLANSRTPKAAPSKLKRTSSKLTGYHIHLYHPCITKDLDIKHT
jgi:hypothetical protein